MVNLKDYIEATLKGIREGISNANKEHGFRKCNLPPKVTFNVRLLTMEDREGSVSVGVLAKDEVLTTSNNDSIIFDINFGRD